MSKLEMFDSAPKFWGNLLEENPIIALTGITYTLQPHGIPSNNQLIQEYSGMLLDTELQEGKWPYFRPIWHSRPENEFDPQTFAVGSLVYIWPNKDEGQPYLETKLYAKHLNYEREMSLKDLERYGIKPMAMVMTDFDCQNNEQNLQKIITTLKNTYKSSDWTIFITEQSFHVVFKEFVNPKNIPWHYGKIIKAFALTEDGNKKYFFEKIGCDLQQFYNKPDKIRETCGFILEKISHYDDPSPNGVHYIVDLRWIAHSLMELLQYIDTGEGSFGFLRISDKSGTGSPPKIVFMNLSATSPLK